MAAVNDSLMKMIERVSRSMNDAIIRARVRFCAVTDSTRLNPEQIGAWCAAMELLFR
jgi:hypothetical protein